jgi:hypothetical protein
MRLQLDDRQVGHLSALSIHQVRELLFGMPIGKASFFYSTAQQAACGAALVDKALVTCPPPAVPA